MGSWLVGGGSLALEDVQVEPGLMRKDSADHHAIRVRPGLRVEIPGAGLLIPERPDLFGLARDLVTDQGFAVDEIAVVRGGGAIGRIRAIGAIAGIGSIGRVRSVGVVAIAGVDPVGDDTITGAVKGSVEADGAIRAIRARIGRRVCLRRGVGVTGGRSLVASRLLASGIIAPGERHGHEGHEKHTRSRHGLRSREREAHVRWFRGTHRLT